MKGYKLTTQDFKTRNDTLWGENVTHEVTHSANPQLCSSQVLHYYKSAELALLLNPIHANITHPVIWECEVDEEVVSDYGKSGCFKLTTLKQINLNCSCFIMVKFANLCAAYDADAAADVAYAAVNAAAYAADAATNAAAYAARAARAAADAADAATNAAAYAAVYAARAAAYVGRKIDFNELAKQAFREG
jgi:hypothetical protein